MDPSELPTFVGDDEWVERAFDRGCKKADGTVKWQALRLGKTETGASVIRLVMTPDEVKRTGRAVKNGYVGFLETKAHTIREFGHEVVDHRRPGEYFGHAEIEYADCPPRPVQDGDPEEVDRMVDAEREFYESLLPYFAVLADGDVASDEWSGPDMGAFTPPAVQVDDETPSAQLS
jgi:hypothetical protein